MAIVNCPECGKEISERAAACPGCGAPQWESEQTISLPQGAQSYNEIPWYRQSLIQSLFLIVNVLSLGYLPLALVTCSLLLTGDIYYPYHAVDGRLRVWGAGRKLVAFVIFVINLWLVYNHYRATNL